MKLPRACAFWAGRKMDRKEKLVEDQISLTSGTAFSGCQVRFVH
jgi:hypothetical protein